MSSSETEKFDPSRRRLCPDGACVGLLDDSGRCKVCGLTASGKIEAVEASPDAAPDRDEDLEENLGEDFEEAGNADMAEAMYAKAAEASGFDQRRKLCPDGACIGVIGADGRCSVCGQAG
jgi:hypothetical protein